MSAAGSATSAPSSPPQTTGYFGASPAEVAFGKVKSITDSTTVGRSIVSIYPRHTTKPNRHNDDTMDMIPSPQGEMVARVAKDFEVHTAAIPDNVKPGALAQLTRFAGLPIAQVQRVPTAKTKAATTADAPAQS